LKLSECLVSNTIPLGSTIYASKELSGVCIAESPQDYENWLVKFLEVPFKINILAKITETNSKDNKWEQKIQGIKNIFAALLAMDNKQKVFDNISLYGITYANGQFTEYEEYRNNIHTVENKSYLFEYNPIREILKEDNKEFLGIFSHKFPQKTGLTKRVLGTMLGSIKLEDCDMVNLTPRFWTNTRDYLQFSYNHHPGLEERLRKVLNHLGIEYKYDELNYTYSNFFILKTELYKEYIQDWINPAIQYMEEDYSFFDDATYEGGLPKDKLKKFTGLDHYTFHAFLLERLPLFFIRHKNLKVKNIL
jgi:hypothetical protein